MSTTNAYAGNVADDNSNMGLTSWSNLSNGTGAANSSYMTNVAGTIAGVTDLVVFTQFGFNLPSNASITDITVKVTGHASPTASLRDQSYQLVIAGSYSGNTLTPNNMWGHGDVTYTVDGTLWGLTPSATQVNAANFGIAMSMYFLQHPCTAYIDCVQIVITYLIVSGKNWAWVYSFLAMFPLFNFLFLRRCVRTQRCVST